MWLYQIKQVGIRVVRSAYKTSKNLKVCVGGEMGVKRDRDWYSSGEFRPEKSWRKAQWSPWWLGTREKKYSEGTWGRTNGWFRDDAEDKPWHLDSFLKEVIPSIKKMAKWIRKIKSVELEGVLRNSVKDI